MRQTCGLRLCLCLALALASGLLLPSSQCRRAVYSGAAIPAATGQHLSRANVVNEGHRFFGTVSRGPVAGRGTSFPLGSPNGYIQGRKQSALSWSLRAATAKLYTKLRRPPRVSCKAPRSASTPAAKAARTMNVWFYNRRDRRRLFTRRRLDGSWGSPPYSSAASA